MSQSVTTPSEAMHVSIAEPVSREPSGRLWPFWHWFTNAAPTAIVFVILGGLAWWGHSTRWTLPQFSSLIGEVQSEGEPWCTDHGVPESKCIECRPELMPKEPNHGWCKVHGIAQCPFEHPEIAQLKKTPIVSAAQLEQAERALKLMPRFENNSRCVLHERRIQFASIESLEKAGVDIAVAQEHPVREQITANGEVAYDETRTAHLGSRVAGSAWKVFAQVGDAVRKGDVLALVESADVGRAKSDLLGAAAEASLKYANFERLRQIAQGSVPAKTVREAEAEAELSRIRLRAAEQTLANLGFSITVADLSSMNIDQLSDAVRYLGLSPELIAAAQSETQSSNLFPLTAPADGVIVDRNVVAGEVIDTQTPLFELTDARQMWLTLNVRQEDAKYLKMGQTVLFRPTGDNERNLVEGTIGWISTSADSQTRTVKVRAMLPNDQGRLRANTFGTGHIVLREEAKAVTVPTEAIHSDGCCNVVFVRDRRFFEEDSPKFFHIRKVRVGVRTGDSTEIIAGLLPGEIVASKNSVVLEAQLLKSNLGAGCCEAHAPKQ